MTTDAELLRLCDDWENSSDADADMLVFIHAARESVALREENARLRADVATLREALRSARGEITRMATDGGGFSCGVIDDIDTALAATERKVVPVVFESSEEPKKR